MRKLIIILIITLAAYLYYTDFFEIDTCLDHGGSWNYENRECDKGKTEEEKQ
jgi:hypothetical protein